MYRLAQSVSHLNHAAQNWLRGKPNWGRRGVVISQMGDLPATLYSGDRYDLNCVAIVPHNPEHISPLWSFCLSGEFSQEVRNLEQTLKVPPGTILQVPFDLDHWQQVATEKYPSGLPEPESGDPTQWLFHGRPDASTSPLQAGVARLLAYQWPAELDDAMRLSERGRKSVQRCTELLEFTDDDGISHEPNINAVADAGITLGCGTGIYCPADLVPRDQMPSFLARALDLDPRLPVMKALGVRELGRHLDGALSLDDAIARAQQATRNYAKRQMTWLRTQTAPGGARAVTLNEQYSKSLDPEIFAIIRRFLLTG
ncbi:MAG: hypothetical protein IIC53_07590 [Proteobacteria bacterium]|nr:hypothetical protein [Pseudomonadota bacterium]